jgi:hypothetical protein
MDPSYYLYSQCRTNRYGDRAWYRCLKHNGDIRCPATAIVAPKTNLIVKMNNEHNHEPPVWAKSAR